MCAPETAPMSSGFSMPRRPNLSASVNTCILRLLRKPSVWLGARRSRRIGDVLPWMRPWCLSQVHPIPKNRPPEVSDLIGPNSIQKLHKLQRTNPGCSSNSLIRRHAAAAMTFSTLVWLPQARETPGNPGGNPRSDHYPHGEHRALELRNARTVKVANAQAKLESS